MFGTAKNNQKLLLGWPLEFAEYFTYDIRDSGYPRPKAEFCNKTPKLMFVLRSKELDMVRRIYVEKKPGFDVEAQGLFQDMKQNLRLEGLTGVRVLNRYDIDHIQDAIY